MKKDDLCSESITLIETLEKLKSDLEKKIAIERAQKALDEMIPVRLAENLNLFKEEFPNIYEHYVDYTPSGKFKIVCNENGEPNLLITETGTLAYGDSPFDDCRHGVDNFIKSHDRPFMVLGKPEQEEDSIGQVHYHIENCLCSEMKRICTEPSDMRKFESVPVMFMFGLGLGFQLGYLYESMTPVNLFIIEPDDEMFYCSLCVFDYTSLINYIKSEHLGINFYLLNDQNVFISNVNKYIIDHAGATLPQLAMQGYKSKDLSAISAIVSRDFDSMVYRSGFFDDMIFGMSHSLVNFSNHLPILSNSVLPRYVADKPVVVVGNGPSLDDDIEFLEKYQDRLVIIACGTAFSALCRRNICADIYVAVERTLDVYDSLIEISDHREFFMTTVCVALDVVNPKVFNLFKNKIIVLKGNEIMPTWLVANRFVNYDICMMYRTNPLVSNMGLELASKLGFEKIYILGIDNGSVGENGHSRFSLYYDKNKKIKEQYKNMVLDNMPLEMPGNFVEKVHTNCLFKLAARMMEMTVSLYEQSSRYFNCSNGMKLEGCESLHFKNVDWDSTPVFDKSMFKYILFSSVTTKLDIDSHCVNNSEHYDKFDLILDQIFDDWSEKPSSRLEFVLREEYQSDFLIEHAKYGLVGARAVQSSLSVFFTYINKVLYYFQDETKAINLAFGLIRKYMLRFFTACKYIYRHTTDYEMGKHLNIYNRLIEEIDNIQAEV